MRDKRTEIENIVNNHPKNISSFLKKDIELLNEVLSNTKFITSDNLSEKARAYVLKMTSYECEHGNLKKFYSGKFLNCKKGCLCSKAKIKVVEEKEVYDEYFNNKEISIKERLIKLIEQKTTRTYAKYIKSNKELHKEIIELTSTLPEISGISERVYVLVYPEKIPTVCKNKNWPIFDTFEKGYRKFCAQACPCKKEHQSNKISEYRSGLTQEEKDAMVQKNKETVLKKYGVDSVMKSQELVSSYKQKYKERTGYDTPFDNPEIQQKIRDEYYEKTGYRTPFENPEIRQAIWDKQKEIDPSMSRARTAYKEQTGYDNSFQVPENKDKTKNTNIEKYGKEYYSQTDEWNEKVKDTSIEKYGAPSYMQKDYSKETLMILDNKDLFENLYNKMSIKQMAIFLGVPWGTINNKLEKFNIEKKRSRSTYEDAISFLLEGLDIEYRKNDYSICKEAFDIKREIDFVIEDKKLCIEMNGTYYHTELSGKKDSTYHLKKVNACEKMGYRLLTITDHEWDKKNTIVVNKIKHALGLQVTTNNTRNTIIKEISQEEANEFLSKYHLQGPSYGNMVCIGAYDNDILVSVMTFGSPIVKNNSIQDYMWDLKRYCGNNDYYPGLASKLLKFFERKYNPYCILSYANRRWSTGEVYKKLGFELISYTKPSYEYISPDKKTIYNRTSFMKDKIRKKFMLPNDYVFVEKDFMIEQGYDILWDCGNIRFEKWYN